MSSSPSFDHLLRIARRTLPTRNPAGAVYGTVITAALIAENAILQADVPVIVVTVTVALLIYWVAHTYAQLLAGGLNSGDRHAWGAALQHALAEEWPMVEASFAPLAILLLVWMFARAQVAVSVALWLTTVLLFVWGMLAGRRAGLHGRATLLTGVVSAAFGIAIASLKVVFQLSKAGP